MLRRILGEITFPDLEELKHDFAQADRKPIIIYSPEKEALKEPSPFTQETKKVEPESVGTEEQTTDPKVTSKDMTVIKVEHYPRGTQRRHIVLRSKTTTGIFTISTMRRITDGDICEEKVLIFEKSEGRWPIKVSHIQGYEGPRCDVISFKTEGDWLEYKNDPTLKSLLIERFIEVKGRSSERGAISIKGNELDAARVYAEQYFLYRLYEKNNIENVLLILNNPLEHKEALENIIEIDLLRATETEKYQLTFGESSDISDNV